MIALSCACLVVAFLLLFAHTTDCIDLREHHSAGTPLCGFVRHCKGSSLTVVAANVQARFRDGGLHLIRRLSQELTIRFWCVLKHGHPDVVGQWLGFL